MNRLVDGNCVIFVYQRILDTDMTTLALYNHIVPNNTGFVLQNIIYITSIIVLVNI